MTRRHDDGMHAFQVATVETGAGNYAEAARLLRKAERQARKARPQGPAEDIAALRRAVEAKIHAANLTTTTPKGL